MPPRILPPSFTMLPTWVNILARRSVWAVSAEGDRPAALSAAPPRCMAARNESMSVNSALIVVLRSSRLVT